MRTRSVEKTRVKSGFVFPIPEEGFYPVSESGTGRNSVAAFSAVRSWCNGLVGLRFPHAPVSSVAGDSRKRARRAQFDTCARALNTSIAQSRALGVYACPCAKKPCSGTEGQESFTAAAQFDTLASPSLP